MPLTVALEEEFVVPSTKDIQTPTIKVKLDFTFDGDDPFEQAKHQQFEKLAGKHLKKCLTDRGKQFLGPIADAQKKIDAMRGSIKQGEKILANTAQWQEFPALQKQVQDEVKKLQEFMDTAQKLIEQAVASIEKIEADRWMAEIDQKAHAFAVKKIKTAHTWKKIRMIAKVVLIGVIVLGVAAAGIATSVLTLNPGPLALAGLIIASVLSGAGALVTVGKTIHDNWQSEDRVMKKIGENLAALGKVTDAIKSKHVPELKKHLKELAAYRADRIKTIRDMTSQLPKMETMLNDLKAKSNAALLANSDAGAKKHQSLQKDIQELKKCIDDMKKSRDELNAVDQKSQEAIADAKDILDDYEKIGRTDTQSVINRNEANRGVFRRAATNVVNAGGQMVNLAAAIG